jgi:broad specificity phosphatase PhoE
MALLFLVRHGQASFGSAHYDRLSDLGRQQARWLGEYFAGRELKFKRVLAGTLARQQDTARELLGAMGAPGEPLIHPGLDEYHSAPIYHAHTQGADALAHQRDDYNGYWRTFKAAMQAWAAGTLTGVPESWDDFGVRTRAALSIACEGAGRDEAVLVVSSGGAICRVLAAVLGCSGEMAIELNLQMRNAAFCELIAGGTGMRLLSFNAIPHLDTPERRASITYA